jgi:uncharacterized lipoprotein YajG
MKKLLIILLLIFFVGGCASTQYSKTYTQKQGLMLQNNTEMRINKKYYNQKRYNPKKASRKRKYKR